MKYALSLLAIIFYVNVVNANEVNPPYIKPITDYIKNHPNDFFTYRQEGTKKEETKFVSIEKSDVKIVSGGSYPAGTALTTLGKSVHYTIGLFNYDPKNDYAVETVSFHFSKNGNAQTTVCNIKHYTQCGYADISTCASMEGGKGHGNKGYSADSLDHNFVYNQELFAICTSRDPKVVQSRMGRKIVKPENGDAKSGNQNVAK